MILRIYNTATGLFLRDDFTFDGETESAYEGDIPGGLYWPKYIPGEEGLPGEWIEGMTPEGIQGLKDLMEYDTAPSLEYRVTANTEHISTLEATLDALYGGY